MDAVVHAAGAAHRRVSTSSELADFLREGNDLLTERVVRAAEKAGITRIVHISSIAASGFTSFSDESGLHESRIDVVVEGLYGRSKLQAEAHVDAFARKGGMGINLRPPLIYGQGCRGNWPRLVRLAKSWIPLPFGSVKNRRSFLAVQNLGGLIERILQSETDPAKSGTYHVADRELVSLREVVTVLRRSMGRSPLLFPVSSSLLCKTLRSLGQGAIVDGLLSDLIVNTTKVQKAFSWVPEITTEEGMMESVTGSSSYEKFVP